MPDLERGFQSERLLAQMEAYRGRVVDLDLNVVLSPVMLAAERQNCLRQLQRSPLQRGDRVVLALGNGPRFLNAFYALLARGASPLLVHADTPAAELKRVMERHSARFLCCHPSETLEIEPWAKPLASLGTEPWSTALLAEHVSSMSPRAELCLLPGVPLHPSSGTTGFPKLAIRPAACAIAEATHYIETLEIGAEDSILCTVPMSHAYGYGMCVMVPLLSHANIYAMRRFNHKMVARILRENDITVFPAVPAMLDILALSAKSGDSPLNVRTVLSAGSPLPVRTALEARQKLGLSVRPLYGTTETGGISISRHAGDQEPEGTVGPPMKGVEVEVRPVQEAGTESPILGELWVRSSSMMGGYLEHERIDESSLRKGWFCTGDLAEQGADGVIRLRGRQSEVINVFGAKVLPKEVEEIISEVPGVREVAVYAGQHPSGSQFVKAAVVGSLTDVDTIRSYCEKSLVAYKCPKVIVLVDALPRSPTGKLLRGRLS